MPEQLAPRDAVKEVCDGILGVLRDNDFTVHGRFYPDEEVCYIDFYDRETKNEVLRILEELGERDPRSKAAWSSDGTITVTYNRNLDLLMLMIEMPVVVFPDGFKRCDIFVGDPSYKFLRITEVHPHSHRKHASVHIHLYTEIKRREGAIREVIREINSLVQQTRSCYELFEK